MSDWYDEEYDDDEWYDGDEHDDWYEDDYSDFDGYYDNGDYWEHDHEPPTLRQRLSEWWRSVTWFDRCGTCGKWQVIFGRFVGNHEECIPF